MILMNAKVSEPHVKSFFYCINLIQVVHRLWLDPNNQSNNCLSFCFMDCFHINYCAD